MEALSLPSKILLHDTTTHIYNAPQSVISVFEGEEIPKPASGTLDIILHFESDGSISDYTTAVPPNYSGPKPLITHERREDGEELILSGSFFTAIGIG